jgi:hypothetical protein
VALKNPICRSHPDRWTGVTGDGIRKTWIHSMTRRACLPAAVSRRSRGGGRRDTSG